MDIAHYPTSKLIEIVSDLLEAILKSNRNIPNDKITHFHSKAVPKISMSAYLSRIYKFAPFSNEALISVLIYFDRISKLNHFFHINPFNIHRLLITSIVVAAKFTSDVFYSNSRYAKVGGISLQELNQLEIRFLFFVDFQLHVTIKDLQKYADQLLSHASKSLSHHHQKQQKQQNQKYQLSHIISSKPSISLPLTPPHLNKPLHSHHYHPYQRSKKLGLISPKDTL
ncbi:unnamed protein product [Rhizopus stolonifer]